MRIVSFPFKGKVEFNFLPAAYTVGSDDKHECVGLTDSLGNILFKHNGAV